MLALKPLPTHRMLTDGMRAGFDAGVAHVAGHPAVQAVFEPAADGTGPAPRLFQTSAAAFIADAHLREEMFGPASVVVMVQSAAEAVRVLEAIGGTLTATL